MKTNQNEQKVKELYEKYPYPLRADHSKEQIIYFAKWVAKIFGETEKYWKGKSVLELGCGTGELAIALALSGASVKGVDFSNSAIKNARNLAKKSGTAKKTSFVLKNILNIKENEFGKKFDSVIALGSLHHTTNAKKGFEIACEQTKTNGLVIIGLYNKYSRAKHRAKRIMIQLLAGEDIEKRIKIGAKFFGSTGNLTKDADKYGQVYETYHSISEVKKWFKENNIEYISSKPAFVTPRIDEIKWLLEGKEAFFVMVGRKR